MNYGYFFKSLGTIHIETFENRNTSFEVLKIGWPEGLNTVSIKGETSYGAKNPRLSGNLSENFVS